MFEFFRSGIKDALLDQGKFLNFLDVTATDVAANHSAQVDIDLGRSGKYAFIRYHSLYKNFKSALPDGDGSSPNGYKIAAALCFSLRRAQPIVKVMPSSAWLATFDVGAVRDRLYPNGVKVKNPEYESFFGFCDEIFAFHTGLRIAHYYFFEEEVKKREELLGRSLEEGDGELELFFYECSPKIQEELYRDILVTLRDHTNGPYTIYLLYRSIFDLGQKVKGC